MTKDVYPYLMCVCNACGNTFERKITSKFLLLECPRNACKSNSIVIKWGGIMPEASDRPRT